MNNLSCGGLGVPIDKNMNCVIFLAKTSRIVILNVKLHYKRSILQHIPCPLGCCIDFLGVADTVAGLVKERNRHTK